MVFQEISQNFANVPQQDLLLVPPVSAAPTYRTMLLFKPYSDFVESYEILDEIGRGQFAVVHRCRNRLTGAERAAKFIRKRRYLKDRRGVSADDIEREIRILRDDCADHPNLINVFDLYENRDDVVLLLELAKGIELFEVVRRKNIRTEQDALQILRQILYGLAHLHKRDIVHLDLKPENIMYDSDECTLKVIDFGLSRKIVPGVKLRALVGTPEFVAPEIVDYESITLATDMWAMGVIAYNLLSGGLSPFLGENKEITLSNVTRGAYTLKVEEFDTVSQSAKDFIRRLLIRDSRRRLTCEECFKHPWLQNKSDLIMKDMTMEISINRKHVLIRKRWKILGKIVLICVVLLKCERQKQKQQQQISQLSSTNQQTTESSKMTSSPSYDNDVIDFNKTFATSKAAAVVITTPNQITAASNNPYVKLFGAGSECNASSRKFPVKLFKKSIASVMPRFIATVFDRTQKNLFYSASVRNNKSYSAPFPNNEKNLHNPYHYQYRLSIAAVSGMLATTVIGWLCASYYVNNNNNSVL